MQIFLKKNAFFGGKDVFFCFFWGVAVVGLEGIEGIEAIEAIETIEAIVWHFFCRRGRRRPQRGTASLLLFPSFRCRLVAVFLPSFCRLFTVFVSRLKATGIGQGITRKIIGIAMYRLKKLILFAYFK